MDLKKEIKLSDLKPKRKPKQAAVGAPPDKTNRRKKGKVELVGLKVGASQIAAAQVVNNGSARLLRVARGPLDSGVVIGGEVRDIPALAKALDEFFTTNDLPRRKSGRSASGGRRSRLMHVVAASSRSAAQSA